MLHKDYKKCEDVIKKNSASFYKAFSHIKNHRKRRALFAVYAFCRIADDIIDIDCDYQGLLNFENELTSFLKGTIPNHFLWRALDDVFKNFDMNSHAFYDMIDGQKMDVNVFRYDTFNELLAYCYRVASSVGLMIIPILSTENHSKLVNCAVKLGYAMQLTNILRDIGEDMKIGRIYLPLKLLEKYNYSEEDLKSMTINQSFIDLWEHMASLAESYYQEAFCDFHLFDDDARVSVELSALFYREILNVCRKANYQVFTQKNFVLDQDKLRIINNFKLTTI